MTNCGDHFNKRIDDSLYKREVNLCYSMITDVSCFFISLAGKGTYGTRVRSCSAISPSSWSSDHAFKRALSPEEREMARTPGHRAAFKEYMKS